MNTKTSINSLHKKFTTFTCMQNLDVIDDVVKQIMVDLQGKQSILEMMKDYIEDLKGTVSNNALPFRKLNKLFQLGITPDGLEGHYYGMVPGLRTGDLHGVAGDIGNLVGFIWGAAISDAVPWVGKSFKPIVESDRQKIGGNILSGHLKTYRGINHFNIIKNEPVNVAVTSLLTFMWSLKKAPEEEIRQYGHKRNGGHFLAYRTPSIYEGTPREVLCLNYRFSELGNTFPLNYLIDEMVEIAEGLYLGQVIFATNRLSEQYDPEADPKNYHYQHFGYFLLLRNEWNDEARRLFPYLEIPESAVSTKTPSAVTTTLTPKKFKTLTLAAPPDGDVNPSLLDEVKKDINKAGSIISMIKRYAMSMDRTSENQSPLLEKLHILFNAGIAPAGMDGFYRGARITFQSHGLLAPFQINTLNLAWHKLRILSPWTGKRFDPIDDKRLSELTDGYEKNDIPTFFGSNTVVFNSAGEKFIEKVMELLKIWMEEASKDEQKMFGYHMTTYFFIGKQAKSILPKDKNKLIFQFNYRWKPLQNFPPDNYCIDQIVQIADGLYLGKLIYATNWLKPWDPQTDPSAYKYRLFGYFLLMDEDWHAERLRIGFDLDNV